MTKRFKIFYRAVSRVYCPYGSEIFERTYETDHPMDLNASDKVQRVVAQDAQTEHQELIAAVREGLADVAAGRTKPARDVLRVLAKKFGHTLPRG